MNPTIEPLTLTETLAVGIPGLALWAWWCLSVWKDRRPHPARGKTPRPCTMSNGAGDKPAASSASPLTATALAVTSVGSLEPRQQITSSLAARGAPTVSTIFDRPMPAATTGEEIGASVGSVSASLRGSSMNLTRSTASVFLEPTLRTPRASPVQFLPTQTNPDRIEPR